MTQNHRAAEVPRPSNMPIKNKLLQITPFFNAEQLLTFEFGKRNAVTV